ncbi:acyltransferase [Oceanimonas sp. NS1]|nr:acyltransferase [Oceanimonas sp. NS1]
MARVTRIVPALLLLVGILLLVGWWALPQGDYKLLSAHSLYALVFLSNVRFWREAGYFDSASHEKWLLHTWSLSVEWQFYLLLPLLLLVVWRCVRGRKAMAMVMVAGFLLSFLASVWVTGKDPSGAFFLLPTRTWEMLAGGLVFLLGDRLTLSACVSRALQLTGLLFILLSIWVFKPDTLWPGFYALLPVAGTVLVLLAMRQSVWLQYSGIQWLGLSSYSLYLWHWPVYVALVYLELADQPMFITLAIGISLLLGGMSYRWVENPTRRWFKANHNPWLAPCAIAASLALIAGPALWIHNKAGVPGRMPVAVEQAAAEAGNFNKRRVECHSIGGRTSPGAPTGVTISRLW